MAGPLPPTRAGKVLLRHKSPRAPLGAHELLWSSSSAEAPWHTAQPGCSRLRLPRKNSSTCSRQAGEAVRCSYSCSSPSPCPPPPPLESTDLLSSEYPADEGSSEFLSPAQPPKCWSDLLVSRCDPNPNSPKTAPHPKMGTSTHQPAEPTGELQVKTSAAATTCFLIQILTLTLEPPPS